jgi:outer membrane protein OmpA-like peptidoglycan-associated protein
MKTKLARSLLHAAAAWALAGGVALCIPAVTAAADKAETKAARLPPLEVTIDPERVDLDAGQLELRASRPAARVTLKILGTDGKVLGEVEQTFERRRANESLTVRWREVPRESIARIEVFAYDEAGYFKGVAITPWSFTVPHEDVVFETDSAIIRASEAPKLRASSNLIRTTLAKYKAVGPIRLFIAGHTDTRGSKEHNQQLSLRRARAIAQWFRQNGLALPIAYQGFGEQALKVVTEDEVDEAQNRRVDYLLSIDPPRFKVSGNVPAWQAL